MRNGHSSSRSRTTPLPKIADVAIYCGLVPFERSIVVQKICIPLNFLMLSIGILMAGDPTKQTLALRIL